MKNFIYKTKLIMFIPFISFVFFACQGEMKFTGDKNVQLYFSTDTLHFDTVFTTVGSTTRHLKIYNKNKYAIKTSVKLVGGKYSSFRLNIDGKASDKFDDLEIMGNDSIYMFAEVNIDPQNQNSPIVISDSILFFTNGNTQDIKLIAYGQDIHLYNDSIIDSRTWINDKPYLIYNSILIDSLHTLTITEGAKIYFHPNSSMLVKGTLIVNGTLKNPVVFQGDRLEKWYANAPGQWGSTFITKEGKKIVLGGIHLLKGSKNNYINYAEIKNGNIGIQIDYFDPESLQPTLILSNSTIQSMALIGIEARTSKLLVSNTVVANCGYYCMRLMYGGNYEFYHSTFANYMPKTYGGRKGETIVFNNYFTSQESINLFPFYAKFANCIVYGNKVKKEEIIIDQKANENVKFQYLFDHCLMKITDKWNIQNPQYFKKIINHKDSLPKFVNPELGNFRLDTLSAAKDKGDPNYAKIFVKDQDGNFRNKDKAPDMGAYERIE